MPFILDLDDYNTIATDIRGDARSVFQPIGHDDVTGTVYQLFVGFDTMPGGDTEFSFCLVAVTPDEVARDIWDAREVAAIIPRDVRHRVLEALLALTTALVRVYSPESVTIRTFTPDLPHHALVKYSQIGAIFLTQGYELEQSTYRGHHTWKYAKPIPKLEP